MKLNKKIANYHIKWNKTINYKYDKIRIVNYFGTYKYDLCFEIRVDYNTTSISHKIKYNGTKDKDYYAIVNKKIVNIYEYNILCKMLTYIHNINLFNCICLVDNNKDQLYYGRRKER